MTFSDETWTRLTGLVAEAFRMDGSEHARLAGMLTVRRPRLMQRDVTRHIRRFIRAAAPASSRFAVLAIGPAAPDDIFTAGMLLAESGIDVASPAVMLAAAGLDLDRLLASADGLYAPSAVAAVPEPLRRHMLEELPDGQLRVCNFLRGRIHWVLAAPHEGPDRWMRRRLWKSKTSPQSFKPSRRKPVIRWDRRS